MSDMISIEFDQMPPEELRGNSRYSQKDWAFREAKRNWSEIAYLLLREENIPRLPLERVAIQYTVYWCGKPIDEDNLLKGMKAVQDSVAYVGIVPDDGPDHVTILPVKYVRVKHKPQVKLVMEITEANDG